MNDKEELQALVDMAHPYDHIYLDPGRIYVLKGEGVTIPPTLSHAWLHMRGSKIVVESGAPTSINSITVKAPAFGIEGGFFDGGDQVPDIGHHRHAVFVMAPDFVGIDLDSANQDGDSFYVYSGANSFNLLRCIAKDNLRNGITFGANADSIRLLDCKFLGCMAQPVDTEPGVGTIVSGLLLHRCLIDPSGKLKEPWMTEDYALTLGGSSPDIVNPDGSITEMQGHDIAIVETEVRGAINIVWGKKIVLDRVYGRNKSLKPCVRSWRNVSQLDIIGCAFRADRSAVGMAFVGTSAVSMPDNIRVEGTTLMCDADNATGIEISGASSARIYNCKLMGNGAASSVAGIGVYARSTLPTAPMQRFEMYDTRIESFGGRGLALAGNIWIQPDGSRQYAHINDVRLDRLSFGNDEAAVCQTTGMVLDDGTGVALRLILGQMQYDDSVLHQETSLPDASAIIRI